MRSSENTRSLDKWKNSCGKRREEERRREGKRERERGRDSRDGTAIITDLLEEISTTQTGCPHHIEMIDSRGEGERGVCLRGACGEGLGEGGEASQRRAGGGARQLAPHLEVPLTTYSHTSSTLPSGLGWHGAGVEFSGGGQIKCLINTPV